MIKENFIKIYEESFKENWALPALTDYGKSKTFTFGDVATEIARIHLLFHECQVRRGDKIALIGKDSSRWCIAYMAVVTYGAIIVPILQDFNPNDVHHIINHSESVFCLLATGFGILWRKIRSRRFAAYSLFLIIVACINGMGRISRS